MRKSILLVFIVALCFGYLVAGNSEEKAQSDIIAIFNVNIDSLTTAAQTAYLSKDFESSVALYLQALRYDINNSSSLYNLACCYGLLGNDAMASFFLKKAYRAGFTDLEHINSDIDFDKVREGELFKAAMDSLTAWGKPKEDFPGEEHFIESKVYLKYKVYLPEGYSADKKYPMIIGLHGYGGDLERFARINQLLKGREVIYVIPEAPYAFTPGGMLGYSWSLWGMTDDEALANQSFVNVIDWVMSVRKEVMSKYPVDKVYLMGFSQGAMLTYLTGIFHPKEFDGLISMGGDLFEEVIEGKIDQAKELPIFIIHGKEDNVVGYDSALKAAKIFEDHGITYQLASFDGGHRLDRASFFKALEYFGIK